MVGTGIGDLPRTCIGDTITHMARFKGSFFALKAEIEPLVSADHPEALLIYVPGLARDRASSIWREVERAGQERPLGPVALRRAPGVALRAARFVVLGSRGVAHRGPLQHPTVPLTRKGAR